MKLHECLKLMETFTPLHLAESWDKVGLQLGDPTQPIKRALLCIDLTPAVVREAMDGRVQLIVAYHPPLFEPVTRWVTHDWRATMLMQLVKHDIAVYSPHTALDACAGGMNDWLLDALGQGQRQAIKPHLAPATWCKFVVFTPASHVEAIRHALAQAGAGVIGHYSQCSFELRGTGTFCGNEQSNPTVGQRQRLERVEEVRLEMVCPMLQVESALAALRQVHPYEEPAYDVYPLQTVANTACGAGRITKLSAPLPMKMLSAALKRRLKIKHIELAPAPSTRSTLVHSIAVCVGAGGSLLNDAIKTAGGQLDLFITGEMRHHDILGATCRGTSIILCGHTQTERPYLAHYRASLQKLTKSHIDWRVSHADQPVSRIT